MSWSARSEEVRVRDGRSAEREGGWLKLTGLRGWTECQGSNRVRDELVSPNCRVSHHKRICMGWNGSARCSCRGINHADSDRATTTAVVSNKAEPRSGLQLDDGLATEPTPLSCRLAGSVLSGWGSDQVRAGIGSRPFAASQLISWPIRAGCCSATSRRLDSATSLDESVTFESQRTSRERGAAQERIRSDSGCIYAPPPRPSSMVRSDWSGWRDLV